MHWTYPHRAVWVRGLAGPLRFWFFEEKKTVDSHGASLHPGSRRGAPRSINEFCQIVKAKEVVLELYGGEPKELFNMRQTIYILTSMIQEKNDYTAS